MPRLNEFQGPACPGPGRGTLPSFKTAGGDLQLVGGPTGGAQSRHIRPQSGNCLGAGTLKPAHLPVDRTKTGFNAQELFINGSGCIGGDLLTICPSRLTSSLDGQRDRLRVTREEVCQDKKEESRKIRSRPDT